MAVYAYCRVSTGRQAEDGESLDVQRRQVEGYATILGVEIDTVYVERGVSGSKPLWERPEGARLLAVLKEGTRFSRPSWTVCSGQPRMRWRSATISRSAQSACTSSTWAAT